MIVADLLLASPTEAIAALARPWANLYGDSKAVATIVTFGHVAALLMAGGLAVATDRGTLRALKLASEERGRHLTDLASVHRLVVAGLALSVITGVLLFASDVETFMVSWIFWVKMALVLLLLVNGLMMTRAERTLAVDASEGAAAWGRLRAAAIASMALWYVITLFGVLLVNAA